LPTPAATLRAAIGDLDAHVQRRAEAIAAPRIAEVEQAAATRITDLKAGHAQKRQRLEDLVGELRRQLTVLEQDRGCTCRMRRATCAVRPTAGRWRLAPCGSGGGTGGAGARLAPGWCQQVDAAAAVAERPGPKLS
jgi:hypothetical protein